MKVKAFTIAITSSSRSRAGSAASSGWGSMAGARRGEYVDVGAPGCGPQAASRPPRSRAYRVAKPRCVAPYRRAVHFPVVRPPLPSPAPVMRPLSPHPRRSACSPRRPCSCRPLPSRPPRRPVATAPPVAARRGGPRPYAQVIPARAQHRARRHHRAQGGRALVLRGARLAARARLPDGHARLRRAGRLGRLPERRQFAQRAHDPLRARQRAAAREEHQRRRRGRRHAADRAQRGAEQLSRDHRRVPDRRLHRRQRQRGGGRDRLLRHRQPGHVGAERGAAPHLRRAPLRRRAQLHQRRAQLPDQRGSAAGADVRRQPRRPPTPTAARSPWRRASRSCCCPKEPMRPRHFDPRVGYFTWTA